MMDYKISVIGSEKELIGFLSIGVSVVDASSFEEVIDFINSEIKKFKDSGNSASAVILVSDYLFNKIPEEYHKKISSLAFPIVVSIPSISSDGEDNDKIKRMVEQAVGVNIFDE